MHDPLEASTRDPDDALDRVLRQELRWEAPAEVTACLLGLIPNGALWAGAMRRPRPQPWYSTLVLILTATAVGLSLAVAWQVLGSLGAELGLFAILEQFRAAPAIGLQRLYEALPASRQVVAVLVIVREQLHWLLLAIMLWLALDGWQPRRPSTRQTP
ncbi:MAG: anti-sigma factor [Chloroflexaceae bacterium]